MTDPLLQWFGELCQNRKVCIPLPLPLDTMADVLLRISKAAKSLGYTALWTTDPADYPDWTGDWLVIRLSISSRIASKRR